MNFVISQLISKLRDKLPISFHAIDKHGSDQLKSAFPIVSFILRIVNV